jgi:uncharacterized protein YdaU (DUF1376 family)
VAQFPALPLFTDAIMADCYHLSDAEFGLYTRILMLMWRTPGCRIPNDQEWIAKRLGRDPLQFEQDIKPILTEFCSTDGNWWIQKRLRKEFDYVTGLSLKGKKGADARWGKDDSEPQKKTPRKPAEKKTVQPDLLKDNDSDPHSGICPNDAPTPTPHQPLRLNPQTPLPVDNSLGSKNMDSGKRFDIALHLDDRALGRAKAKAPGWDIYFLMRTYNEGVSGRGIPDNPAGAFIAWCAKYTKGRPP